jgi:4-hydroxybutyrate CoA-transferase
MQENKGLDLYRSRIVTAEKAISLIDSSSHNVFLAPFCNEPQQLVKELIRQKERFHLLNLYTCIVGSPCLYAESEGNPHFFIRTFLGSSLLKGVFHAGNGDYIPLNLSELPEWVETNKIDFAMIQVTPPNQDGYCNLGISVDIIQSLSKHAGIVIAQVNSNLPRTFGDTEIHVSKIDYFVESNDSLLTISSGIPNKIEEAIGKNVAQLIPDYATIQVGIGKIADAVLLALKEKKGLGVHSGSITDGVVEMMKRGVITNERKELMTGKTVCTTLTGSEQLYSFANHNKDIHIYPADFTHNSLQISKIKDFYSINSALEVDLTGQINAEQIGDYPLAGVGGQMDFIRGARLSKGGRAIIAHPSTAMGGSESRIKNNVSSVTSLKSEVDYIVTEYGIASLFGKSLKERRQQMLNIVHPNFRESLSASLSSQLS